MPIKLSVTKEEVREKYKELNDVEMVSKYYEISVPTVYRYIKIEEEIKTMENVTVNQDLENYIPKENDSEIVGYMPRQNYLKRLETYLDKKIAVLLIGEAGTGKTSLARYKAFTSQLPFLEISCDSLLGFRELLGQVNITDGTSHFIEGIFTKMIQQPSIILLDEITALDPGKNFMLHQLLQSREFFVKEANRGEGKVYKLHPQVQIIMSCNPPTGKYPGTNRMNVALVDRPQVIWIEELTMKEVADIIPPHVHKERLLIYYKNSREVIQANNIRTTFSIRGIKKIISSLDAGMNLNNAIHDGFLNGVRATSGEEGYRVLLGIAKTVFSI